MIKNLVANAGDTGDGFRSPGEKMATHTNILDWESLNDRRIWWDTVHGTARNRFTSEHAHRHVSDSLVLLFRDSLFAFDFEDFNIIRLGEYFLELNFMETCELHEVECPNLPHIFRKLSVIVYF